MDGVDILHLEHREKSEMDYSFFFEGYWYSFCKYYFITHFFLNPDKKMIGVMIGKPTFTHLSYICIIID